MTTTAYRAKIVLIGDVGVGKTSLLLRFTDNKFHTNTTVTLNKDFKKRDLDLDGRHVTMEVWDTAGQERYRSLTSSFFRDTQGLVLVFDLTDFTTFTKVGAWLEEAESHGIRRHRCLLVGNKADCVNGRVVDFHQASAMADRLDLAYTETSAKDNLNVLEAFVLLGRQMLHQMPLSLNGCSRTKGSFTLKNNKQKKEDIPKPSRCGACGV